MGPFGKDPWEHGIRTRASIERVMVTTIDNGGEHTTASRQEVFLTFCFTDEHGAVVTQEHKCMLHFAGIPPPGSTADVAYLPGKLRSIDFDPLSLRAPDPSVPRGWGAGIFEVDDLGTRRARSPLARHEVDRQRELFRTGWRGQAQVISVQGGRWRKRGTHEWTFRLRVQPNDYIAKAWAPAKCVPQPGDLIQVAISADGMQVALDCDERYDGPPAQALVFTTPPEVAARRAPAGQPGWTPAIGGSVVDMQLSSLRMARAMMGPNYEMAVRTVLEMARASGSLSDADYAAKLQQALA